MQADAMSFTFLGNEGCVKIPFFQRGYVWKKDNWEDLFDDLYDKRKSHFLGSIILKHQEKRGGKPAEVLVIDGQQRLTTLSVLLQALYDSFSKETKERCKNELYPYLFFKTKPSDKDYKVKISHSRIDSDSYKKIIESKIDDETYNKIDFEEKSPDNKILQCYKYFSEKLKLKDETNNIDMFDSLLDNNNKILVIIDLSSTENEQAIFDTINNAGVRLSSADTIKNSIYQKAIELFNDNAYVINLYTNNWEDIFAKDEEITSFWDTQRPTGRLMRANLEILLHCIAVIKGWFDPVTHTLRELPDLYKKHLLNLNKDGLVKFIEEIKEYATIYKDEFTSFDKSTLFAFKNNTQRFLHILDTLEISTFHPYILHLLKKYSDSPDKLSNYLLQLEKFVVRRMIIKEETKSYNKLCKEIINDENMIDQKLKEIDDNRIEIGLKEYISNKSAALLLFWIELYRRDIDSKQALKELKNTYSLEHIMPQKWKEYWANVPVRLNDGTIVEEPADAINIREEKIYCIGNMTLLSGPLNTALRNYTFDKKVNGVEKKKGMRHYAELTITNEDIIQKYDSGDKIWDEFKIEKRTKDLTSEVVKIW